MRLLKSPRRKLGNRTRCILAPERLRNDHACSRTQRRGRHMRPARNLPSGMLVAHRRYTKGRAAIKQHVGQHQRCGEYTAALGLCLIGIRDRQAANLAGTRHAVKNRAKRPLQLKGTLVQRGIAVEDLILLAHLTTA